MCRRSDPAARPLCRRALPDVVGDETRSAPRVEHRPGPSGVLVARGWTDLPGHRTRRAREANSCRADRSMRPAGSHRNSVDGSRPRGGRPSLPVSTRAAGAIRRRQALLLRPSPQSEPGVRRQTDRRPRQPRLRDEGPMTDRRPGGRRTCARRADLRGGRGTSMCGLQTEPTTLPHREAKALVQRSRLVEISPFSQTTVDS